MNVALAGGGGSSAPTAVQGRSATTIFVKDPEDIFRHQIQDPSRSLAAWLHRDLLLKHFSRFGILSTRVLASQPTTR
jgi:hypothetical protein